MSIDVPIGSAKISLAQIDERSREIFRQIVESYLATGEPVGSRNISRLIPMTLSPASVRNVMADLEALGLVYAPHTSAGRLPTELGLRFFVDALMEIGDLSGDERKKIEAQVRATRGENLDVVLAEASQLLSGLSRGAGVVTAHKTDARLKQIEYRAARARPGARGARLRGRPGREPAARSADRRFRGQPRRSHQFPERPHPRQDALPKPRPRSSVRWLPPAPNSMS